MKIRVLDGFNSFSVGEIVDATVKDNNAIAFGKDDDIASYYFYKESYPRFEIIKEENKDISDDLQCEINEWTIKVSELENKIIELENKNKELQFIINTTVVENERRLKIPVYSLDELKELKELLK